MLIPANSGGVGFLPTVWNVVHIKKSRRRDASRWDAYRTSSLQRSILMEECKNDKKLMEEQALKKISGGKIEKSVQKPATDKNGKNEILCFNSKDGFAEFDN